MGEVRSSRTNILDRRRPRGVFGRLRHPLEGTWEMLQLYRSICHFCVILLYQVNTVDGIQLYGPRYKSLYYFATIHNDAGANSVCDEFHGDLGTVVIV